MDDVVSTLDLSKSGEELLADLAHRLNEAGSWNWMASFPISHVHNAERIKSDEVRHRLIATGLVGTDGVLKEALPLMTISTLKEISPTLLQTASLVPCRPGAYLTQLPYAPKREGDYWRRLQTADFAEAVIDLDIVPSSETTAAWIEHELQHSDIGQWQVEKALRDAVRSKKENTPLRQKPYIWMTVVEGAPSENVSNVEAMLRHYFGQDVLCQNTQDKSGSFCMGFSHKLDAISLRTFFKKKS